MNNEKLNQLFWFLEEALRLKIYLVNFLYYIRETYNTIKNFDVYNERSFVRFAQKNADIFFPQLLEYKGFEKELENFLLENTKIENFLFQNKLDFAIIKTHFDYYEEIFKSIENERIEQNFFEDSLNEYIELIEAEIIEVDKFKSLLQDKINELNICYICKTEGKDSIALYTCEMCGKMICDSHLFSGNICLHCSEKIVEDYTKKL